MTMDIQAARVRVPCSTSNLGSGFDTLGLALNRYLAAEFEPGDGALEVMRTGTLEDLSPKPGQDLLVLGLIGGLEESDAEPTGVLRVHSEIPVAQGLGSSAAALVAGYHLGQACLGWEPEQEAAYHFAAAREGHGDNAAACALGGFRAVVPGPTGQRQLRLELSAAVGFAYAAPPVLVSTEAARSALPQRIPHARAVESLGRITTLLSGMSAGDSSLLRLGVEDRLHVPYRLPFIPGAEKAVEEGYEAGAWAVTVSGSGSGLLAMCAPGDAERIADVMRERFDAEVEGRGSVGFAMVPDYEGVRLER
jgi:homoserine kinase